MSDRSTTPVHVQDRSSEPLQDIDTATEPAIATLSISEAQVQHSDTPAVAADADVDANADGDVDNDTGAEPDDSSGDAVIPIIIDLEFMFTHLQTVYPELEDMTTYDKAILPILTEHPLVRRFEMMGLPPEIFQLEPEPEREPESESGSEKTDNSATTVLVDKVKSDLGEMSWMSDDLRGRAEALLDDAAVQPQRDPHSEPEGGLSADHSKSEVAIFREFFRQRYLYRNYSERCASANASHGSGSTETLAGKVKNAFELELPDGPESTVISGLEKLWDVQEQMYTEILAQIGLAAGSTEQDASEAEDEGEDEGAHEDEGFHE